MNPIKTQNFQYPCSVGGGCEHRAVSKELVQIQLHSKVQSNLQNLQITTAKLLNFSKTPKTP